jgi:small subunit ribosomal protein S21
MKHYDKKPKKTSKKALKGGDTYSRDSSTRYPSDAVQATPLEVKVYGNNFDKALRAFRALVQKERILSSYKEKQTYEKPSDKKRRKNNEAKRKQMDECSKGHRVHAQGKSQTRSRNRDGEE